MACPVVKTAFSKMSPESIEELLSSVSTSIANRTSTGQHWGRDAEIVDGVESRPGGGEREGGSGRGGGIEKLSQYQLVDRLLAEKVREHEILVKLLDEMVIWSFILDQRNFQLSSHSL